MCERRLRRSHQINRAAKIRKISKPAIVPPAIAPLLLSFLPVDNCLAGISAAGVDAAEATVVLWATMPVLEAVTPAAKGTVGIVGVERSEEETDD